MNPAPYYQDERRTLYHADCRAMDLDALGAHCILTDPPRGVSYDGIVIPTQVDLGHLFALRIPACIWAVDGPLPGEWDELLSVLYPRMGITVLDPYAGSGAVIDAAVSMGMRGIAIEIEEHLCQAMAVRWARPGLQL